MDQRVPWGAVTTIDADQLARFDVPADAWWNDDGEARWLHKYNRVRVPYICDAMCPQFGRGVGRQPKCLTGLRILDVGCGGGVLCEPLARLGAHVVGADPAGITLAAAERHAKEAGLSIDYRCTTVEALAATGELFDAVTIMEVIEHVADADTFLSHCADLVRPGGLMFVSTISRTVKSLAYAIVMAEYVLGLLPRGTHQWRRFVRPEEMSGALERDGFKTIDVSGVGLDLRSGELKIVPNLAVNYLLTAVRTGAATT
jgi:2-polyprenyl-6-hydroxyphenyl methylase/3-demethylubiquinone-9 3-methyltransferase